MRYDTNPHYNQQYRNATEERHKTMSGCTAYTRTCTKCGKFKTMSKGCKVRPFVCAECVNANK